MSELAAPPASCHVAKMGGCAMAGTEETWLLAVKQGPLPVSLGYCASPPGLAV